MDLVSEAGLRSAKLVAAVAALTLLWILESVAPMFVGRERRVSHDWRNLLLGLLNAVAVGLGFGAGLVYVTQQAAGWHFGLLNWLTLPDWLEWLLAIVLFDSWQYLWHLLNHRVPLLARFHAVHHSDGELDASSGLRFHTGEIVLSALARLAVLPILGMTLPQLLVYEVILVPIVFFHHSNVRVPPRLDRALRVVIVTPRMHWVHHSRRSAELNSNYSSIFSVWDRAFGSFRLSNDPASIELGLETYGEEEWRSLSRMLLAPFRSRQTGPMS